MFPGLAKTHPRLPGYSLRENAAQDKDGCTPLHKAAHEGRPEVLSLLLNESAVLSEQSRHLVTHKASQRCSIIVFGTIGGM